MTIKELYNKINSWPEDIMDFCITDVFSWRGVYAEPACSLACIPTLKQDNLDMLNRLVYEVFDGWKGGEFRYCPTDTINFECDCGSYSDGKYLTGFLARNHSPIIDYIFGEEFMSNQITNKELQDLLKQYPDNAVVVSEYCNIRELRYSEENNLITID